MAGPTIVAKFLSDTTQMTTGVDTATSGMGAKIKSFATNAALAIGGAFAATKVVDFARQSIDAASDLNESISKIGVVFGQAGDGIIKWSENAAEAMGMSQNQALAAAGTYGNLAVSMGLPQEQASGMSTSLVQLAADLASFNNVPVDQALQALQSGLVGETEPLRQFGINLNDAALRAEAMAMGLQVGTGPLDAATKMQASYSLIMKQSTTAQGDFARTADGLANSTKTSAAQFEDMKAKLGNALLPVMNAIVGFISDSLIPAFEAIGNWISDHQDVVAALAIGLGAVATVIMVAMVPSFIAWAGAAAAAAISTFLLVAPLILIGAAVAGLAFLIISNWDTIKAVTAAVWNAILGAIQAVWNWISANWPLLLTILTGPFGLAVSLIITHWDSIKNAALAVWNWLTSTWSTVTGYITAPIAAAANILAGLWASIRNAASAAVDWVISKFQGLASGISGVLGGITSAVSSIVNAIKNPVNALIRGWNSLGFTVPTVTLPKVSIPGVGDIGGGSFGGQHFDFPNLPLLARGGVLTSPTLFVGGESGTEIVTPEDLLRTIIAEETGGGPSYVLNLYPRTADSSDVAYAFRRLEIMAGAG